MVRNSWFKKGVRVLGLAGLVFICLVIVCRMAMAESSVQDMLGRTYFLGCNLHMARGKNRAQAFRMPAGSDFLAWGTAVRVGMLTTNKYSGATTVTFQTIGSDRRYHYEISAEAAKTTAAQDQLSQVFLSDSSELRDRVAHLAEVDRRGIAAGRIFPGMTKAAVLIAIGYPGRFAAATPLEANVWHYEHEDPGSKEIRFDEQGMVANIVEGKE